MSPAPQSLIIEKNKLIGAGAWVALLEIAIPGEEVIRLAKNNEDITWSGEVWTRFEFDLDTMRQDGQGGLPSYSVKISNISREFSALIDAYAGATDADVVFRVVHSDHLDETEPLFMDSSRIIATQIGLEWITFTLGAASPMQMLSPRGRYLANHCRYKEFKGSKCGYTGTDGSCDRTIADCRAKGNFMRFGGFPAISQGLGVYI